MLKRMLGDTKLLLVDDLSPEDVAMLQALYSRSGDSAEGHVERIYAGRRAEVERLLAERFPTAAPFDGLVAEVFDALVGGSARAGNFMRQFYVGYGHKSIADCGSTTLFIEGVSMLAAKAVQDWPLYSGQESSTRYLDMAQRPVVDPVGTAKSAAVMRRWLEFYCELRGPVAAEVRRRYPRAPGEDEDAYERAVRARAFDVQRGFLPAGCTTQLSWHTNLRQAGDHLSGTGLLRHPLEEVRYVADGLAQLLAERYPSSGQAVGQGAVSGVGARNETPEARADREAWERDVAEWVAYPPAVRDQPRFSSTVTGPWLPEWERIVSTRPRGAGLPHFLSDLGQVTFRFDLDFGSFRDVQRHRNGVCRMPVLTTDHGFEPWYLDQLDPATRLSAARLLAEQEAEIEKLIADDYERQYCVAMGYRVPCSVTYGLPAAVYVLDLRSGRMIHPTLRRAIAGMVGDFRQAHPAVRLHVCEDPDPWDTRRGAQDIVRRSQ